MKFLSACMVALAVAAGLLFAGVASASADDAAEIRHLMMKTFDKPDAPLTVDPVTVSGTVAVAGWAQGAMGGRALLRRKPDGWALTLCSGDQLKEAKALEHFGLSPDEAAAMAQAVVDAEAKLDPALVAKFSSFDGVVMMDEHGNHQQGHGHGG